jgi:hypothetical protein
MLGPVPKALLFMSAYIPLWGVVVVFDAPGLGRLVWVAWAMLAAGFLGLLGLAAMHRNSAPEATITLKSVERKDLEAVIYIVAYILPFLGAFTTNLPTLETFAVLFVISLLVTLRTDAFYVNPVLAIIGIRVYRVEDEDDNEQVILTRRKTLKTGSTLSVVSLADGLWREKKVDGRWGLS